MKKTILIIIFFIIGMFLIPIIFTNKRILTSSVPEKIEEINIIHENTINALNSYLDFSNKSKEIIRTLKK